MRSMGSPYSKRSHSPSSRTKKRRDKIAEAFEIKAEPLRFDEPHIAPAASLLPALKDKPILTGFLGRQRELKLKAEAELRARYQANLKAKNIEIDNFIMRKRRHFKDKSEKLNTKLEFHKKVAEAAALKFTK